MKHLANHNMYVLVAILRLGELSYQEIRISFQQMLQLFQQTKSQSPRILSSNNRIVLPNQFVYTLWMCLDVSFYKLSSELRIELTK